MATQLSVMLLGMLTVSRALPNSTAITSTDITADNIKIGVDGATEISTTSGDLILDSQSGKVHITDNAEVDGNLQVDGNTTLGDASSDTLTVNATSTFNAQVDGNAAIWNNLRIGFTNNNEIDTSTGNLTLDSAGGSTTIDDDLSVTGASILTGQLTVNDSILIDATNEQFRVRSSLVDRFTIDSDNGNTFIGTTQIEGLTTINDNLDLNGNGDVSGTLNVANILYADSTDGANLGNNFSADGALRVAGGATVAQNLGVGGNLQVYGDELMVIRSVGNQEFRGRVEFSKSDNPNSLI